MRKLLDLVPDGAAFLPRLKAGLITGLRKLGPGVCLVLALLVVLDLTFPPPMDKAKALSPVVLDRSGAPLRAFPLADGRWRIKADLDRTDPAFVQALLAYEDKRFYSHMGVDGAAMMRASFDLAKAGRVVSGGSTITMQTARLLEPRKRTVFAKLYQVIRAVQLERRMSKDEILELYLTLAPYGGNLEGVRAASWAYFGHEPSELTPDQIALLIALPQSPEARRPDLRPDNARKARRRVLDRLVWREMVTASHADEADTAPIPSRLAFPTLAWHASEEALRHGSTGDADIRTTLDIRLQSALETMVLKSARRLNDDDTQISMMVVDTKTRNVVASVGSASRDRQGGWLDLTNRARSPGSTLKPFIYGLAFDDGLAAPATRISDLPRRFQNYRPENFDRTFRGDVTVAEALQHSLNVPAVHVLDAVGPRRFAAVLGFAGAAPVMPEGADTDAGLALALGGAGMSVRDLASIYAALGADGLAGKLRWVESDPVAASDDETRLLSRASARSILDILRRAPAPVGRMPASLTRDAPQVAFKTGTSYGARDAWAAGVSGRYAAVVWVGRADGAPRPGATGRQTALPILFDAFDIVNQTLSDAFSGTRDKGDDLRKAPKALKRFVPETEPPQILFPPNNAEIWADKPDRAFVLAARGAGDLAWFAEGRPVALNAAGDALWRPNGPGFYTLTVVDPDGRSARTRVRVSASAR